MIHACVLQQYNRLHNVTKRYMLLLICYVRFCLTAKARLFVTIVLSRTERDIRKFPI